MVTFKILPCISGTIEDGILLKGTSKPEGKDNGPEYAMIDA
jgi:hypothetical protein